MKSRFLFLSVIVLSFLFPPNTLAADSVKTVTAAPKTDSGRTSQASVQKQAATKIRKAHVEKLSAPKDKKTFMHTINQPFAGSQSPDDAKVAAVAKGKTEVLEKAGTYLESLTVVEDFTLTKDQSIALASGILNVDILSQKNYATDDGFGIVLELKVDVDNSVMNRRIKQIQEDRILIDKYSELKKREKELLDRIEKLEKQNREITKVPTGEKQEKKARIRKDIDEAIQALPAVEWNKKALALWEKGKYNDPGKALEYLNESIKIDAYNPVSYNNRGVAYYNLGKRQPAIDDFNHALLLDNNYADAFNNRGVAYFEMRQYHQAINDYDEVIRLKPQRVDAFLNRAAAYKNLWQYRLFLEDLQKALRIDPNLSKKPNSQISACLETNELERLCEKAETACKMGLCNSKNFLSTRGFCR
jgi:tetratricopeptide (TPR) repeat protein